MTIDAWQPRFAVFAVSRTGNRGAVSMLESAIDYLTAPQFGGVIDVFTVYPKRDRAATPRPNVNLYGGTPAHLVFKLIPLTLLHRLLRVMHLPMAKRVWGRSMNALLRADAVLLIGGTTFTDAQPLKVIYNVACVLPAILLGKRIVFYSQTLGPFRTRFNRVAARFCLARAAVIHPRGNGSRDHVRALGFTNVQSRADSAFTLDVPAEVEERIRALYAPRLAGRTVVGISTNSIVERKCGRLGIDHNRIWAEFIEHLQAEGYCILLVPHSIRPGSRSRHNNDLHTLQDILSRLTSRDGVVVVDTPHDCKELRVVVGMADYYIASRFHSMISALCTGRPVLVFGWGYQKYREVLADFELESYGHDAADLSTAMLTEGLHRIIRDAESIREKIRRHLPEVQASSLCNHEAAWRVAVEKNP